MVAGNPLFQGGFTVRKFNSTVINDVWPETLFFTGIAVMITCITNLGVFDLNIDSALLGVLGTVLGLVISFRTSSAYERYQEGRKLWTTITIASRSIAQLIWIHVPVERKPGKVEGGEPLTPLQSVIEKKSMINLIGAFSVSVKHFLRSEPGIYYEDLYPLISFLPRYGSKNPSAHEEDDLLPLFAQSEEDDYKLSHPTSGRPTPSTSPTDGTLVGGMVEEKVSGAWYPTIGKKNRRKVRDIEMGYMPTVHVHRPLKPARNPPTSGIMDYLPFLRFFKWVGGLFVKRAEAAASLVGVRQRNGLGKKKKTPLLDSNVPVEITMYLSSYANYILTNGYVEPPVGSTIVNQIGTLQDTLSNLERIRSTPLPFAYQAHLRMSLWLYLLFLPFQVVGELGWITIPGTAFASFLFLGFLEIGAEIEDPFGYDSNDLPVDEFVLQIQREMYEITVHHAPNPREYMFSSFNQPFAPADRRSAETLLQLHQGGEYAHEHSNVDHGMDSIKRTLLKSWKNVDCDSRKIKTYS